MKSEDKGKTQFRNGPAMPGGKIVKGILQVAQNRDGLAVIIGHEIAHVVANHGNERMGQGPMTQPHSSFSLLPTAQVAQIGVMFPYSRVHESEAMIGVGLLRANIEG